jgi:hypothetical protein
MTDYNIIHTIIDYPYSWNVTRALNTANPETSNHCKCS